MFIRYIGVPREGYRVPSMDIQVLRKRYIALVQKVYRFRMIGI